MTLICVGMVPSYQHIIYNFFPPVFHSFPSLFFFLCLQHLKDFIIFIPCRFEPKWLMTLSTATLRTLYHLKAHVSTIFKKKIDFQKYDKKNTGKNSNCVEKLIYLTLRYSTIIFLILLIELKLSPYYIPQCKKCERNLKDCESLLIDTYTHI